MLGQNLAVTDKFIDERNLEDMDNLPSWGSLVVGEFSWGGLGDREK